MKFILKICVPYTDTTNTIGRLKIWGCKSYGMLQRDDLWCVGSSVNLGQYKTWTVDSGLNNGLGIWTGILIARCQRSHEY